MLSVGSMGRCRSLSVSVSPINLMHHIAPTKTLLLYDDRSRYLDVTLGSCTRLCKAQESATARLYHG